MRKIILIVLLAIVSATAADCQKKNRPVEKAVAGAPQIIQFMTDWANFSNRHDVAALNKLLPVDLVLTFQDGEVQTRDEYLAALKNNPADFTIKDYDQKVNFYSGDVAVLHERYEVTVGTTKTNFQNTTVFLKRNGRWQPIAFHSSPLGIK